MVTKRVAAYARMVQHQAARLGYATHAANHFVDIEMCDGGVAKTIVRRDTTAERPWKRRKLVPASSSAAETLVGPTEPPHDAASVIERIVALQAPAPSRPLKRKPSCQPPPTAARRRAATAAQVKRNREAIDDAMVASHVSCLELRPSANPMTAQERLEAVLAKGRAKLCRVSVQGSAHDTH